MKKTLILLFATIIATTAFGQNLHKTTSNIQFYNKPNFNSGTHSISAGTVFGLGAPRGDFFLVFYNDRYLFMPEKFRKDCIPVDPVLVERPILKLDSIVKMDVTLQEERLLGGDELYSAGKLLLTGTLVTIGGGILTGIILYNPKTFPQVGLGLVVGVGAGITGLVLEIVGYTKLMKAGKMLRIGPTSSGIGMTINLNSFK